MPERMLSARDVAALPRAALHDIVRRGNAIDARALDDTAYRGLYLGLPATIERLVGKTFVRAFHRDPSTGALRGWTMRGARASGHFVVTDGAGGRGLLLDYSDRHGGLDPRRFVREPIVAVNEGDPSLLLGWTYLAIGPFVPGTPLYFLLERDGPLSHIA
jgi:hypothetical protein